MLETLLLAAGLIGLYDYLAIRPIRRAAKHYFQLRPWYKFWKR